MTKTLKGICLVATLLIGAAAAPLALAVATLEVTTTGSKTEGSSITLFDSNNKEVRPTLMQASGNTYTDLSGDYSVRVTVRGEFKGETKITLTEGQHALRADTDTGVVTLDGQPMATIPPMSYETPSRLAISAGAGTIHDKPPGTGVLPGDDTKLLAGSKRDTTYGVDVGFQPFGGMGMPSEAAARELAAFYIAQFFGFDIGGSGSDPSTSIQVPAGTEAGWSYWTPAPTGSTGISSALGTQAHFKTRFAEGHVNWGLPYRLKEQAPWSVLGGPMLGYQRSEFKYNASISNLVVPGVSSTTDQKTKEDDFSAGYGVWGLYTFPNRAWAGAGAGLRAIFYHARYNGTQDNLCSVCAAPTDHFTVTTSDSKSGITFGALVNAVVGFPVAQNADIFLLGTYDYRDKTGVITSKVTPTDDAPHLRTSSRDSAYGQLGIRVKF